MNITIAGLVIKESLDVISAIKNRKLTKIVKETMELVQCVHDLFTDDVVDTIKSLKNSSIENTTVTNDTLN
jgi:hypothetical protein